MRAEAQDEGPARNTLADIISPLGGSTDIEIWGPVPAPMARRADRHRLQCVLIGARGPLHRALGRALAHADGQRYPKVRWSVDVDPHDLI